MSIGMSPFRALYGYDVSTFAGLIFGNSRAPKAKDWIQESQDILKVLKDNLQTAQNQQEMYVNQRRVERSFEDGDLFYLRLQLYKQSSLKQKGAEKLKPKSYEPYRVSRRIGEVAYELELPEGSKIHNVFHVSYLKKAVGQQVTTSSELPPLDEEGQLVLVPEEILQGKGSWEAGGHMGVSDQVEGSSYRGCHLGRRARASTSKSEVAWGQAISGREDCNVPIWMRCPFYYFR